MSNFTQRVLANNDDGTKLGADWFPDYYPFFGGYSDLVNATAGFRFTNVTVPAGAVITSAYLKYTSQNTDLDTVLTKIYGIDEDNTASMLNDPTGRATTAASIDWDIVNHTADTVYTSPDIKNIVQEIIDRAGWNSGQAMGFLILDDGSADFCVNVPYGYETDSTKATQLVINYIVSSLSPSVSPSLSPSVSPSTSPSAGASLSPSLSPSFSPSASPSVSLSPSISPSASPSISISPSKSPSISPSMSPSPPAPEYGIKIKKQGVAMDVEDITDPKDLVFTSGRGVLGLHTQDTVTGQTDASGNINVTDNHGIGYTPIVIVTTTAYDGNRVVLPTEWHSFYVQAGETIEVTEQFNVKIDGTKIRIIVHAEQYNHDTFVTSNIASRNYSFEVYYYFNELIETV